MKIKYHKVGDYYYPNLEINKDKVHLSKYGRMKLIFMKEYQKGLYFKLLSTNELNNYLQTIDVEASELYDQLLVDFKKKRNITGNMKEKNQMLWIQEMNNVEICFDALIKNEVIYA